MKIFILGLLMVIGCTYSKKGSQNQSNFTQSKFYYKDFDQTDSISVRFIKFTGLDFRKDISDNFFIVHKDKFNPCSIILQIYRSGFKNYIKYGVFFHFSDNDSGNSLAYRYEWWLHEQLLITCDSSTFDILKSKIKSISQTDNNLYPDNRKYFLTYLSINDTIQSLDLKQHNDLFELFKFVSDSLVERYNWKKLDEERCVIKSH